MRQGEGFASVSEDKETLLATAKAMGIRASRDHLGVVTLELSAANLSPKLREFSEKIAITEVPPIKAADLLVRTMLWARRQGHLIDEVLREAASELVTDPETIGAISAAIDREVRIVAEKTIIAQDIATSPHLSVQPSPVLSNTAPKTEIKDELHECLTILARQASIHHDDPTKPSFLEKMRAGEYISKPRFMAPRDFADFVRRVSIYINRAIERHGETYRLRGLRSMIDAIRDHGVDLYEREDPDRAARLMALGPDILTKLDDYVPDPSSTADRVLPRSDMPHRFKESSYFRGHPASKFG